MKKITIALILFLTPFILFAEETSEKTKEQYIKDLDSKNVELVTAAEIWLGEKDEKSVLPKLHDLLTNSKSVKVRMNAAVAIGLINEKESTDVLVKRLLAEKNSDVRYSIVLSITRIGIESKEQYKSLLEAKANENDPFILDYIEKLEEKLKLK